MNDPIRPGSTIGIVGGGQLGRMLTQVAHRMGYRVVVLTGGPKDTPAGVVAEVEIAAPYDDDHAIERFMDEADVITWEFENVDATWATTADVPVRPSAAVVATAQDRLLEKQALTDLGVPVAPWRHAATRSELARAVGELGGLVIVKTARWGYDGKGQLRLGSELDVEEAWRELGGARVVVESLIDFDRELSVVVARGVNGDVAAHGVMENVHVHGILDSTIVPATIDPERTGEALELARRVVDGLEVVGVACIELFEAGGELIVNEIAPRPHNSGHCTIEAASASQFEQQLRAICGLPLGDGRCRPAAMVQVLGELWSDGEPDWSHVLEDPEIHLHLYGKAEPRAGRKMGHLTCVGEDARHALRRAHVARQRATGR